MSKLVSLLLQAFTEARKSTKVNEQQPVLNTQGKELPESREDCAMQNLVLRLRGGGKAAHALCLQGYLALAHRPMRINLVDTELAG